MLVDDIMAVKKEIKELKEQSLAMEMLSESKKTNKRICVSFTTVLILVLCFWFATICYLVHVLNDIGTIEETITQENDGGYNNYIGNDGDIINGNTNN